MGVGTWVWERDILVDIASQGHIDDLDSPAYAEDRLSRLHHLGQESQFHGISHGGDAAALPVGLLPKQKRMGVRAAGEKEAVEGLRHLPAVFLGDGQGQRHRDSPGSRQRRQIGRAGEKILIFRVVAGSQADERFGHRVLLSDTGAEIIRERGKGVCAQKNGNPAFEIPFVA